MKNIEKIARICWNKNNWKRPSGSEGKSKNDETYESEVGFGHEEWLLDDSRIYKPNGYHYGFLEQLRIKANRSDKHVGQNYNIHLFTRTPDDQKVYVGCIKNAIVVSKEESRRVYEYYEKNEWIASMKEEILYAGGKVSDFDPEQMFNVKFKFADADLNLSNMPILNKECIKCDRYVLMDMKSDLRFETDEEGNTKFLDTANRVRIIKNGKIIIDPRHQKIQNALCRLLEEQYKNISLEDEHVDLKGIFKKTNEWHYYEIKTDSAKKCIREALGQILEYAHYPNKDKASCLYIVGPQKPDKYDLMYMKKLRETYHLPIWFRWYSFEKDALFDEEQIS